MRVVRNLRSVRERYPDALRRIISLDAHREARSVIESWPGYAATPLHELSGTASELGVGRIWLKDEGQRFGLGAFKSTGGAYAVYHLLAERVRALQPAVDISPHVLIQGEHHAITSQITIVCASAGNHGRAVAWGARMFGAQCVVYLYDGVSAGRRAAIQALGAVVDCTSPSYDEAVRRAAAAAAQNGWLMVSDTAYPGYMDIPRIVMQGYTVIAQEAVEQLAGDRPTHVILQAGVGGFAAAIAAHVWESFGPERPTFLTVEPSGAACVLESIAAQRPIVLPDVASIMGGLCCGQVSLLAWPILEQAIDFATDIPDEASLQAMRSLAQPRPGAGQIVAGESGAAGLAALVTACTGQAHEALALDHNARVLLFSTEGATDPATWARYTNGVATSDSALPESNRP